MPSQSERNLVEVSDSESGAVRILRMNRPDARNALSRALVARLLDELSAARADPRVRAIVLTANGPVFSAGLDFKETTLPPGDPDRPSTIDEERLVDDLDAIADLVQGLHDSPKPTIAAMQGSAYAGGAALAVACDFAIAVEGAEIGYPEVARGMAACIAMVDLVRKAGDRRARELLLTGEPVPVETAAAWGVLNRVTPAPFLIREALSLAERVARNAPNALAVTKAQLDETGNRPTDLRAAAALTAALRISDEAKEGFAAFAEKRPPRWGA